MKTAQDNLSFAGAGEFCGPFRECRSLVSVVQRRRRKASTNRRGGCGSHDDFSAWVKFQGGFSGFDPLADTDSFLTMEFLDAASAVIGTSTLDLLTVVPYPSDPQGEWNQFSVNGTAPANTVSVRVSAGATGMMSTSINPQSAFFDDFALQETLLGAASFAAVPEPGSIVLLMISLGMIGVGRRRS